MAEIINKDDQHAVSPSRGAACCAPAVAPLYERRLFPESKTGGQRPPLQQSLVFDRRYNSPRAVSNLFNSAFWSGKSGRRGARGEAHGNAAQRGGFATDGEPVRRAGVCHQGAILKLHERQKPVPELARVRKVLALPELAEERSQHPRHHHREAADITVGARGEARETHEINPHEHGEVRLRNELGILNTRNLRVRPLHGVNDVLVSELFDVRG